MKTTITQSDENFMLTTAFKAVEWKAENVTGAKEIFKFSFRNRA